MRVLVAGCGWLGTAVARALLARGDRVTGVRSDPARAEALRPLGVEPLCLDLADPAAAGRVPADVEAVVACQSAGGDGEAPYRRAYVDANRSLLAAAARLPLRAFVYTGSTGLFGQRDGSDVDEETPPMPTAPGARVLVEAERLLLEAAAGGVPARIVRLSGLYGPGRTGIVDRVRRGVLALGPGDEAWMNFCHQEDAVAAVLGALDRGRSGAVYHGTDAGPMRRREVVEWLAGRLGIAPPRAPEAASPSGAPAGANRRILGERTRAALGLSLRWPTLREGLAPFLPGAPG
jgi:nucleoside-diphosphate-sugar epimerase